MTETVFYDGTCGLCHRAVKFLLRADREGTRFRFAPLGGETFRTLIPDAKKEGLPDSIVLRAEDGRLLVKSAALLHALERLGGRWRALAALLRALPGPIRDAFYDVVALVRLRLFVRPTDACPVVPPSLQGRFDA